MTLINSLWALGGCKRGWALTYSQGVLPHNNSSVNPVLLYTFILHTELQQPGGRASEQKQGRHVPKVIWPQYVVTYRFIGTTRQISISQKR